MQVQLTNRQGQMFIAYIDEEDTELFKRLTWRARLSSNHKPYLFNSKHQISFHRAVTNAKPGEFVDHINGNTLDNRKANLRICSQAENNRNSGVRTGNYKGVDLKGGRWRAQISYNRKKLHLGLFKTEVEAAIAYNNKALELHGEFARLNQIVEEAIQ